MVCWVAALILLFPLVNAEGAQTALGFDLPATSINLEIAPLPQHVVYVAADPFYLDLGLGYKVYFVGNVFDQQNLTFFARAEAVYSFINHRFDASNVAVGLEASPVKSRFLWVHLPPPKAGPCPDNA